jgi:hypothetical protein
LDNARVDKQGEVVLPLLLAFNASKRKRLTRLVFVDTLKAGGGTSLKPLGEKRIKTDPPYAPSVSPPHRVVNRKEKEKNIGISIDR